MRFLIELGLVGALVALTWNQSLLDRYKQFAGVKEEPPLPPPPQVRYVAEPAPSPTGDWMWDPSRRSALDRPAYDARDPSLRYQDATGRNYWIDSKGSRRYDP